MMKKDRNALFRSFYEMCIRDRNKTIRRYTSDRELNRNKGADIMKAWERLINYVPVRTPSDEES